ncbi:MAG: 1,4-alpha-glucan branching protein GlgB, partial [Bacteroidota bacterium]
MNDNHTLEITNANPPEELESGAEQQEHFSLLSDFDVHLFREGNHYSLYEKLGSHLVEHNGVRGVYFAVWAPNAHRVAVVGDFNGWNNTQHNMNPRWDGSGIWELFIAGVEKGNAYKYYIDSNNQGYRVEKGDPFAIHWETAPKTATKVWDSPYEWQDQEWMDARKEKASEPQPETVYEVHLGSWKRKGENGKDFMTYRDLAEELPQYLNWMGYTHVEFMPIMEHPFYGSWGYQLVGFFAPTSRFGTPEDFKYLVDKLHQAGIGVILDWVPSHFPSDEHGLAYFDGTHLFEHEDPKQGYHPDWNSYIFNYGRNEVRSFLVSSAMYWLREYHIDGLRVDAVASMLYLDYSREEGEWIPNKYGGRENLEALQFLREFNNAVDTEFPEVQTIAEESTAWPMVSRPTEVGGLGFEMKWMMGWMHDTLEYFAKDPIYRSHHQGMITFSL